MTLDNMFAAARGKMTDDKKYEVGQISEKTGLQKQPDGSWAPPKNGGKKPNPLPPGKDYTQKAPGKMQNAVNYLNGKTEDPAEVNEFLKNNGFKKAGEENTIRMAGGPLKETTYQDAAGNKVTLRTYEKNGKQAAALKYEGSTAETAREARSERANPAGTKEPPKRESVSAGRMQKDLDGNFWSRPDDFKEDISSRGWDVEEMNSEYAVISNEAGSQYEVRFDPHSDDGDLTVRTFKPLMIDEDDDDVEDSAPAPRELTRDTKIRVRRDQVTDKKYEVGQISEKTGLQKQPDGSWAPPRVTKYGKVTTNKNGEVGIQQTLGKGSKFEKFADEKSASRALANLTAGYYTTERSKEDPHSDKARQIKHWNKETERIKKENKAERRAAHAAEFQKKVESGESVYNKKNREI